MITGYDPSWLHHLKDIDIKSYNFAWLDEDWVDIEKWIIKVWVPEGRPRGFIAFRFSKEKTITIAKLAVHPNHRNKGGGSMLLEDIVAISKLRGVDKLLIVLHEDNEFKQWALKNGFLGVGIEREAFPDGRDGYRFLREIT